MVLKASGAYFQERQRVYFNTPLLKSTYKISHAPGPRTEAVSQKEPGSETLADLGEPCGEAGGNWDSPWSHRHWQQPFWGVIPPQGHWCWEAAFWNPPSSLSVLGPRLTHQQPGCLEVPEPLAAPRHDPTHQWAGTSPGTHRALHQQPALTSRLPAPQPATPGPGSTHQWTSTSPGYPQDSIASYLVTQPHHHWAGTRTGTPLAM